MLIILTELADIIGVAELMFSHITEHHLIALAGIIIPHEEIIIPIQDKEDIPVRIVHITITDRIAGGSSLML